MIQKEKTITVYVSEDGKEFTQSDKCKQWEQHLKLNQLHQKLIECNFHDTCRIRPYFHNTKIKFIGRAGSIWNTTAKKLTTNNSYLLMNGRMGNGDDRVRYKFHGSTIVMLKYSTDADWSDQEYLCSLPSSWIDLPIKNLKQEVKKFITHRNETLFKS